MSDRVDEHLPLTPRVFHILLSLLDGPNHGYAVMQEVEARSDGKVTIGPGTLYEAIHGLRDKGLIRETDAPEPDADSRRRTYELTEAGAAVLKAETERLSDLVAFARDRQARRSH